MKLSNVIKHMDARVRSDFGPSPEATNVSKFTTDSRSIKPGEVFFAFSQPEFENHGFNGEFADATRFVRSAIKAGAIACVVREDKSEEHEILDLEARLIFVEDVIGAFQNLAHRVAAEWNKKVVAVTGSAGKTTAKEIIAHVLSFGGKSVLKNEKNFNNGLGHPMTVLKLAGDEDFDVAVLEMGMSTPKREIARLCEITPPNVAVVLNVLPVHLEHLGTIENIAKAKAELVEGMVENGLAILNADDQRVLAMKEVGRGRVLTYGIENNADFSAKEIVMRQFGETHFVLKTPDGDTDVVFQLSGKHNILNALAASAVGYNFGMTAKEIGNAISTVKPPRQRGEILRYSAGFTIINDSYNSNPDALNKMVSMLVEGSDSSARRIVLAGEMLELGEDEKAIHNAAGVDLAAAGVDLLVGVRGLAEEMVAGAIEAGIKKAKFFDTPEEAGRYLSGILTKGDVVLVKGSRGVRTEKAIEEITKTHSE